MARETDSTRIPDASEDRVIECPVCSNTMTRMEFEGVTVDVCAGELAGIRTEFATEEERKQAAQEYFAELFDPDLAVARAQTMEDLRKAQRIAHAFRFICPSYYIPGQQDWGAF
ncbi:hypothetical protein BH18ACT11_BH18ACT11_15260 [soil metagenome]